MPPIIEGPPDPDQDGAGEHGPHRSLTRLGWFILLCALGAGTAAGAAYLMRALLLSG